MRGLFVVVCFVAVLGASAGRSSAAPIGFTVTTLATELTDPGLVNAWGIASSATSPFWIGSNGAGTSEIYTGAGVKQALIVTIPGDGSVTGVAFNGGGAGSFNGDAFLFVSEDGTVSGWRGALGTTAENLQLADAANVYKGLAVGSTGGFQYAYAANFSAGRIDVLKGDALAPDLAGKFIDPGLPAGYAPFNIANINGTIYVTYALQDATGHDDVAGPGNGIVSRFDLNGNLLGRVATDGALNSPWGLALAPAGFGDVGGALLVGNFGDGLINAYDPITGMFLETLVDGGASPIVIDGLWGLSFGNGAGAGSPRHAGLHRGPGRRAARIVRTAYASRKRAAGRSGASHAAVVRHGSRRGRPPAAAVSPPRRAGFSPLVEPSLSRRRPSTGLVAIGAAERRTAAPGL